VSHEPRLSGITQHRVPDRRQRRNHHRQHRFDTLCGHGFGRPSIVRHDDESLGQLLIRLNRAIEMAVEDEIFIDEINYGQDDRL
jgi:hypothetical protein